MPENFFPVSFVAQAIRNLLLSVPELQNCWVLGEVSNVKRHTSGHIYFDLKDSAASLNCVIWRSAAQNLSFLPEHGKQILAFGSVTTYAARSSYQLTVKKIEPYGLGALHAALEQLKTKLREEGLFAAENKKPLPRFPQKIALVTSPTGAAVEDVQRTLGLRWPLAEIQLFPTLVQGTGAARDIVKNLQKAEAENPDVILLVRGGGSLEDLWSFNEEAVVRAVAASPVPIVTGVGHETDQTLVDLAADAQGSTPTAAAMLAVPDHRVLLRSLQNQQIRLAQLLRFQAERAFALAANLIRHPFFTTPELLLQSRLERQEFLGESLQQNAEHLLQEKRRRQQELIRQLELLGPHNVLARGFAIARDETGRPLVSVLDFQPKIPFSLQLKDGSVAAETREISGN